MKFFIVLAMLVAAATAQYGGIAKSFPNNGRYNPQPAPPRYSPPQYSSFPTTAAPFPRPTAAAYQSIKPVSRVTGSDLAADTIRYDNEIGPDGSFKYAVETTNGISAQAQGTPRQLGGNPPVAPVVIQGSYAYTSPEGYPVIITYEADENGFRASGDAIPTPPPVPEAILRSLEFNAKYAQKK